MIEYVNILLERVCTMVLDKLKLKAIAYPLSALFIIASIIIDGFIFENRVEAIWMANILSILVVTYIKGFKSGIIISGIVTGSHILFSILVFSNKTLINTVFFAVFFFAISVLFCYLVDIVQRRVNILEAFRQSPNAMFWVRLFNPEKVFVAEGIARLYGVNQKDFERSSTFWMENIVNEDLDKVKAHERKYLNGENSKIEFRLALNNGEKRWIESYAIPIRNQSGKPFMVCGSVIDITSKKEAEIELEYMAYHDAISGLKNRFKLEEDLNRTCIDAKENNGGFSLLFLDVGRLKEITDTVGHNAGDRLLKEVGNRLINLLGIHGNFYRYISQEFIILLKDTNREKTESIASDIINCLSKPVTLSNGREVFLTPKVGIVCSNEVDELVPEYLITAASLACASVKSTGVTPYVYYNATLRNASNRSLLLEDKLQNVLANNELDIYYQGKVNLSTNKIVGVEALLRWNDPSVQ
jgi:diguanylate cyclase (GGDEF)-like protein/PAS domain S-box-containing protein